MKKPNSKISRTKRTDKIVALHTVRALFEEKLETQKFKWFTKRVINSLTSMITELRSM